MYLEAKTPVYLSANFLFSFQVFQHHTDLVSFLFAKKTHQDQPNPLMRAESHSK